MAHTAHDASSEYAKEHFDSPEVLKHKVEKLHQLVKGASHFCCFTGAGISTSAGIPDFRGPQGKWTLEAKGQRCVMKVAPVKALPTPTHMALVELSKRGYLKYLISQNCDGLHLRSGFPANKISELHGNSNIEECEDCGQQFFRDFACHRRSRSRDHYTGRHCGRSGCNGRLLEYTIDFGQNLPEGPMERGFEHAEKADLHMVLGSSLTVNPACTMPELTKKRGGKLVIVNLQKTPLTRMADLHIYAKTDTVMEMLMERLGSSIPNWYLRRRVEVGVRESKSSGNKGALAMFARGIDQNDRGLPNCFIRGATMKLIRGLKVPPEVNAARPGESSNGRQRKGAAGIGGNSFKEGIAQGRRGLNPVAGGTVRYFRDGTSVLINIHNGGSAGEGAVRAIPSKDRSTLVAMLGSPGDSKLLRQQSLSSEVTLHFFGHYNEPPVVLRSSFASLGESVEYELQYDYRSRTWQVVGSEVVPKDQAVRGGGAGQKQRVRDNRYGRSHAKYCREGQVRSRNKRI